MARNDFSHLVPVRVLGPFDIVSTIGYRDEEELQWDERTGGPLIDPRTGDPVVKVVEVPITVDVPPGGVAWLDPAVTKIRQHVLAGVSKPIGRDEAGPHPATVKAGKK